MKLLKPLSPWMGDDDGNIPPTFDAAAGDGTTAVQPIGTVIATAAASPFVIHITFDSSVTSATPVAFTNAVLAAASYLESRFTDAITLNIVVGWGQVNGTALGSTTLGASEGTLQRVTYSSLVAAVRADATSATDTSVVASLPATTPISRAIYWTTTGEAKALGLLTANNNAVDGYIGFSSTLPFTYDDSAGVASGTYDFNGTALHELTEVMGRMLFTGTATNGTTRSYTLFDLLHYSAPGTRDLSGTTAGYFSVNGGNTSLGAFNTDPSGDAGDWASSVRNDSFDAFSSGGVVNAVSANDLAALDAIGWNACYRAGTRIATAYGETPVEALRAGDLVRTHAGALRPVAWVGWRRVDCRRHPRPELVWPIRIAAGAFGARLPARDLFVSPDHAIFIAADGVLIPARYLVNGATITAMPVAWVEYHHVELATHDILLAEGLPAESYLDTATVPPSPTVAPP